ncbi:MAG: hypothetical protein COV73_04725, partial [Candidatus Omnitrophica bacterium CG11_big_fil_rev_8_21_14_0_20_43_6]
MRFKILVIFLFCYLMTLSAAFAEDSQAKAPAPRGVWVSVFSAKKSLYSEQGVRNLIAQCNKAKVNEIYLQI